ncbi:MAG: DNA polymerase I [Chlamydiia bacterium]
MKFYVVDASSFLFRSYFAIRNMRAPDGFATNALYGFVRALLKILEDFHPEHIAIVYDAPSNKASRQAIYPDYKGKRHKAPDDLPPQIEASKEFCDALGIQQVAIAGVEADDTIGTLAKKYSQKGYEVYIFSSDKDLCQMINENTHCVHAHKDNLVISKKEVFELYQVYPEEFTTYLGLIGDASDNIPGVAGIGPKKGSALIRQYKTIGHMPLTDENKELAELSKTLATIDTHVPLPAHLDSCEKRPADTAALQSLYQRYNFKSLLTSLETKHGTENKKLLKKGAEIVHADTNWPAPLSKPLALYFNEHEGDPGVFAKFEEGSIHFIPENQLKNKKFLDLLGHASSILTYDYKALLHKIEGAESLYNKPFFDILVAAYLLNPDSSLKIADILQEHAEETIAEGQSSWFVQTFFPLTELLETKIREGGLSTVFHKIEEPLLWILFKMEKKGIFVDTEELTTVSHTLAEACAKTKKEVEELLGHPINLNSPKQLAEALFVELKLPTKAKGKTGYSTSIDVLEELRQEHPIIEQIIEYRSLEKLRSTYTTNLIEMVDPHTHRLHTTFSQTTTQTGRLASTNPNLQNIPVRSDVGNQIRHCFKSMPPSKRFISCDYSQVELRLLAHMSEDPSLMKAFQEELDIHRYTASLVFGIAMEEVTEEMRFRAKAVNFGIIYGLGPHGLSKQLKISMKEASQFIKTYFERYPKVKGFLESLKEEARKSGHSTTLFGRKRPIPEILNRNAVIRAQAERFAVNSKIQGTQADLIKMAMIEIDELLDPKEISMLLQIHDELIFECDADRVDHYKKIIVHQMQSIHPLKVPLEVHASVAKNWGEC